MRRYPTYTYEELMNNYEFKTIRKLMIRKFPWITDITILDPTEINDYSVIFVNAVVDPSKLKESYDMDYGWLIKNLEGKPPEVIDKYLKDREFLTVGSFMDFDDDEDVFSDMRKVYRSVRGNSTIPNELKLNHSRSVEIESFTIDDNFIEKLKNNEEFIVEDWDS